MRSFVIGLIVLLSPALALADEIEGWRMVERLIPDMDSAGIRDTMIIPAHFRIDDINFYVDISNDTMPWGEEIMIDVSAPYTGQRVGLNGQGGDPVDWYEFWYDTDREEDGPGQLEDYAGLDAEGPWEMFCFDPFPERQMIWHTWRIQVIGEFLSGVDEPKAAIPVDFTLGEIYPNPFNSVASIEYGVPYKSSVTIEIFDILGRKVKTLQPEGVAAGYHHVVWDGTNELSRPVASGVYLIKMTVPECRFVKRALLLK